MTRFSAMVSFSPCPAVFLPWTRPEPPVFADLLGPVQALSAYRNSSEGAWMPGSGQPHTPTETVTVSSGWIWEKRGMLDGFLDPFRHENRVLHVGLGKNDANSSPRTGPGCPLPSRIRG
jgi:hypothetical protein